MPIWAQSQTTPFVYTGNQQTYTLPANAIGIQIEAVGGGGGGGGTDAPGDGGSGAVGTRAVGIYTATAGTTVNITVGGGGARGITSTSNTCTPASAGLGGSLGGIGGVAGGPGGPAGCNGYSGGGGGGGGATVVRRATDLKVLLVSGGGSGGQGGALNVDGRSGLNLLTTTTATTVSTPVAGGTPTDGGGGGGGGGGCPGGASGAANPDSVLPNTTLQANSGTSCYDPAFVSNFLPPVAATTAGAAGVGGVGDRNVGTNGGNGFVTITPLFAPPTVVKSFTPATIVLGGTSVLTLTLTNDNPSAAILSSALVDTLPGGMRLLNATFGGSCTGGKSGTANGNTITYASASTIPANSSCTITANVTSTTAGTATNTIAIGALNTSNGNNAAIATADLMVRALPTVTLNKTLSDTLGGVFSLSITGGSASGGTNPANNIGNGGSTGPVTVLEGSTLTLTEAAGTGTLLANYTSSLSCVDGSGSAVVTTGSGTSRTVTAPSAAATGNARNLICTFTNTEPTVAPLTKPLLGCSSNGNIFNTAYNGNPGGAAKTSGLDNVWQRGTTFGAMQPPGWAPATVVESNPGWSTGLSIGSAGYIAQKSNAGHVGNVDLWYQYVFKMDPLAIPSTFRLAMDFYADNSVREILVNGVPQSVAGVPDADPYESRHYNVEKQLSAVLTNNWLVGDNTLRVRISSGLPYLGFMARNTLSVLCAPATVTVSKVTQGGAGGPFTIVGAASNANGFASQSITTTVAGTAVSAATQTLTTYGVVTDLQENAIPAGYSLSGISCTGLGAGGMATPNLTNAAVDGIPARSVRLDTAATAAGSNIACTFTNRTPTIQFTKLLSGNRVGIGDQFALAIRKGGVSGTVVSNATSATTTGSGAIVTAGTGTTGSFFSAATMTAYTLTEAGAAGADLANYTSTLSCVDTANLQTGLPSAEVFNSATGRTLMSVPGAALVCTLTNTPIARITLKKAVGGLGRLAVADQFTVDIRTGGVSGTVVNSTANSTTLGSAASVTTGSGSTGVYAGVPGTAYTLNEAMALGSTSTLSRYTRTLGCANVGGTTNVSSFNSLPLTFSPVAGDNVVCTVTNTPAAAGVAGRVFLDNGVISGTANDGLINGGEAGLSGITVRLTNCAANATVYASSTTDGTGAYNLAVPTSIANGAALCVEQTNQVTRISTGASVGSTALLSGVTTSVASTLYTYTRIGTPDKIAFTFNGTGHAGLNFGDVDNSTFTASGAKTGLPGTTVTFAHTFTAGTAGSVSFDIASATPAPALAGWSERIYLDQNCSGSLQPNASTLYPPAVTSTLTAGQVLCMVMQEFIPATAQLGNNNSAKVRASFNYTNAGPTLSASYTVDNVTTVSNSALELKKEVRNVARGDAFGTNNQAKSGEILEYRIRYTNNASTPIRDLLVSDTTPAYTSFISSNTGTTPATLTACTKNTPANPSPALAVTCTTAQSIGSTGPVNWKFTGSLNPSDTGDVMFQVRVD